MIKFKRNAAAGIIAIGLILSCARPASATNLFANVDDYVNVRINPNIQSEIVGYMFNNDMAQVIQEDPITGWVKVRSGSIIGWVNPNYFIQDNLYARGKVSAIINTDNINVYTEPTQSSFTIDNELKNGDRVSCVNEQGDWLTIRLQDGSFGFIEKSSCNINQHFNIAKNEDQKNIIIQALQAVPVVVEEEGQNNENVFVENQNINTETVIIPEQTPIVIEQVQQQLITEEVPIITEVPTIIEEAPVVYQQEDIVIEQQPITEQLVVYEDQIVSQDYYDYVNSDSYYPVQEYTNVSNSDIVSYADQYIGNPYVWGGNSLTDGIDCSHFVWQVLSNTGHYDGGYAVSDDWAYLGSDVGSLDNAVAGDVIVYPGHVAIYDGEGGIVEAKGQEWGITHDRSADSGEILAIRHFD